LEHPIDPGIPGLQALARKEQNKERQQNLPERSTAALPNLLLPVA
jgi:hypothetical protein